MQLKASFIAVIYQAWTITLTFQSTKLQKIGSQPIMELFSPRKSWLNSTRELANLAQYNPLFSE